MRLVDEAHQQQRLSFVLMNGIREEEDGKEKEDEDENEDIIENENLYCTFLLRCMKIDMRYNEKSMTCFT